LFGIGSNATPRRGLGTLFAFSGFELNLNFRTRYANLIGFDVARNRFTLAFSGTDLEATAVKGAFDFKAFEKAIREVSQSMRAEVVGRVQLAVHAVDCEIFPAGTDRNHLTF
jgi:hypothetical protein